MRGMEVGRDGQPLSMREVSVSIARIFKGLVSMARVKSYDHGACGTASCQSNIASVYKPPTSPSRKLRFLKFSIIAALPPGIPRDFGPPGQRPPAIAGLLLRHGLPGAGGPGHLRAVRGPGPSLHRGEDHLLRPRGRGKWSCHDGGT